MSNNTQDAITERASFMRSIRAQEFHRDASVLSVNRKERTVELSFSSEYAEGHRGYGIEVLSHEPGACDLSRLNSSGAVLEGHNWGSQRGVVVKAWIDHKTRTGRALVKLSRSAAGEDLLTDVEDGIKVNISVGYVVKQMKQTGERNGVDVYTVTRWQPIEISFVPIPFDPTVGVGRSPEILAMGRAPAKADSSGSPGVTPVQFKTLQREDQSAMRKKSSQPVGPLIRAIQSALNADPFIERTPPGFDDRSTRLIPVSIARVAHLNLYDVRVAGEFLATGQLIRLPMTRRDSKTVSLRDVAGYFSRAVRFGATVLPWREIEGTPPSDEIILRAQPAEFRYARPANLVEVADGDEVPVSELPTRVLPFNFPKDGKQYAVSFNVKRSDLKPVKLETLESEILNSIADGIGQLFDRLLLGKVAALPTLAPFSVSALAATGLLTHEVAGIVGTSGTGAAFAADGTLRANGVEADTAPAVSETIIGAFTRLCIVVDEVIDVRFARMDTNGNLGVTVFINALPLVLDNGMFWKAAA